MRNTLHFRDYGGQSREYLLVLSELRSSLPAGTSRCRISDDDEPDGYSQGFAAAISNTNDQPEEVPVCLACAQAMRGKYRLTKIEPDYHFTCAIGKRNYPRCTKRMLTCCRLGTDLKFHGSFRCLNHKVDLTRHEAENTLFQRQEQLEQ